MKEKRLLTVEEVAKLLGVAISTVYGWTSRRKIPFRKAGSLLRFDYEEIIEWSKRNGYVQQFA